MATLTLKDVGFCYGERRIFSHLSLSFPDTGLFVILGRSGSGKTTLLSLCAKTLNPTEGLVSLNKGERPSLVFQSPLLLDYLDVMENVLLPAMLRGESRDKAERRAQGCLDKVGLPGFQRKDIKTLSGGEKMRVSLARALMANDAFLILDEPTGQLDEKTSEGIYLLLKSLADNRLVLLVTHDEKGAGKYADGLYLLKEGSLLCLRSSETKAKPAEKPPRKERPLGLKAAFGLTTAFLRKRMARFLLSGLFLSLSLSFLYLGIDLAMNLSSSLDRLFEEYYDSEVIALSQRQTIAQSGHLALERFSVPEEEVAMQLGITEAYPSLSYFLPESNTIEIGEKENVVSFLPVLRQKEEQLSKGRPARKMGEVVVNSSFLDAFDLKEDMAIGESFSFRHSLVVRSATMEAEDLLKLNYTFEIVGIGKEKSAFNSPTCYFSYSLLADHLSGIYLENLSEEFQKALSVMDLFEKTADRQDDFRGGKVLFSCDNPQEIVKRGERLYGEDIRLSSKSLSVRESTEEIVFSLLQVLLAFLTMTLLSAFMHAYLSVYSLYDENIRLFALTRIYPGEKKNRRRLSCSMLLSHFLLVTILVVSLSLSIAFLTNAVLSANAFPPFLNLLNPGSLILVLLAAFLFSFFATIPPMRRVAERDIKRELEGED